MKVRFLTPIAAASLLLFCAAGVTQGHEGEPHDHDHGHDHNADHHNPHDTWLHDLAESAARGKDISSLLEDASHRGMTAALAAVSHLDDVHPKQRTAIHELISIAGRCRGWPAELLRRYDPVGYATFYSNEGLAFERRVAACLKWEKWETTTPDVLVRAAPRPTLEWLMAQSDSATPNIERVGVLCRTWATWARQGREQQYDQLLAAATAKLLNNKLLLADTGAVSAIARLAGNVRATAALPALIQACQGPGAADSRQAACAALGRLGSDEALAALLKILAAEADPLLVGAVAAALDNWPDDVRVGAGLLSAFRRIADPAARRSITFTAVRARWPQRSEVIGLALVDVDGSVVGAALQAMAARVERGPTTSEAVLAMAPSFRSAQPNIVDALGAIGDPRSSMLVAAWLNEEANPALRAKLAVALGNVGDPIARRQILDLAQRDQSGLVVEQAILAIEALAIEEAIPTLLTMAADRTAPMGPRLQALRALSRFDKPEVRKQLESLWQSADTSFAPIPLAGDPATRPAQAEVRQPTYERVEQARLYIAAAQLRLGEAAASARLQQVFDTCTATTQFHGLWLLGSLKLDHPAIARGLTSDDLAVLMTAVRAASRTRPQAHLPALEKLDRSPWLAAMANSSMDTLNIKVLVREALGAAKQPATRP